jgi:hypothetical protein
MKENISIDKLKRFLISITNDLYASSPDYLNMKLKQLDEIFGE